MTKPNVLIVYGHLGYPARVSILDMIYAFRYNKNCNAFIYSIEQGPLPEYLKKVDLDLVIFSTTLVGERWSGQEWMNKKVYEPLSYLKNLNVIKVTNPQDEWIHTKVLNKFINDFNITHVFSVAPESEWKKIYNEVNFAKVRFHSVLTGYLEDKTIEKIDAITQSVFNPAIDIGYRAYKAPPWLGSHGFLKTKIADIFIEEAPKAGFRIDISTEEKNTFLGDDWFKFMANCKYFIGVEGGSTVIDPDGDIFVKGTEYEKENPNASFAEFEKNCFPNMDGNLNLVAISPRHLEACAAKTCQVLIEGEYNGVLEPNVHYIELKKDFSNLQEVFSKMKNDTLRKNMVERAYKDIVRSKKYSYLTYTDLIIENSLHNIKLKPKTLKNKLHLLRNKISDKRFWERKKNWDKPALSHAKTKA